MVSPITFTSHTFSSLPVLNKKIKVCLGWDASPPMDHAVPWKKLRDEGFAFVYCMKDSGEAHFKFVHHNISTDDMNDGEIEYGIFGKVGLNNLMSLSRSNILQMVINGATFIRRSI